MKGWITVLLLILSNVFMTLAWYGHLRFQAVKGFDRLGLPLVILLSWGIALLEYCFQVPANRLGYRENGGPYSLVELRVIQEVISLSVFAVFTLLLFRSESIRWNHLAGFVCLVLAVFFLF